MLSAIQTGLNQIEVEYISLRHAEFGQVQVRMIAAGICGAQLMELSGAKASGSFPHIMGHEGVGIVEHCGPGVSTVKAGDKVVLHWRKGDGIESDFPKYGRNGVEFTSGKVVTWAEMVTVSENRVTRVDPDAPDELCVLLGCGLSTALGTLEQEANLKIGETVLIIGCGGLGMNLIRAAQIRGASHIVGVDKKMKDMPLGVPCICGNWFGHPSVNDFDVVIDTTGDSHCITQGIECLAPGGRFIMVGQPKAGFTIKNGIRMFQGDGKTIKATQGGGFRPAQDIPRYVNAWRAGVIDLEGIITHRMGLKEIREGITLVEQGNAGRVLIEL